MDLTTRYMGLALNNPIVASASPLSGNLDGILRLEEAGAAAIVIPSLFEEQVTLQNSHVDYFLRFGTESSAEAIPYFEGSETNRSDPDAHLSLISRAKEVTGIPIIASLNGVSAGGWTRYAPLLEEAGADAIELNIYYLPTDPAIQGRQVEQMHVDVLAHVRESVRIPVAMKIGPYFSATAQMARRLSRAGANALVLFNRFYQPDFDIETLDVAPRLVLSQSDEIRLPLHWVAILYGRIAADFAVTSGVHTHQDVLKTIMVGANVALLASELLQNGVGRIGEILTEMERWMEEHEYPSVAQMRGIMSQRYLAEPAAFEGANYLRVLQSFNPPPHQ